MSNITKIQLPDGNTYAIGSSAEWGNISGTLTDQTDLNTALKNKQDSLTASQLLRVNATAYLKTTYVSGTSGYNIWSNGYCEQWGQVDIGSSESGGVSRSVTYLKTFKDTNYFLIRVNGLQNTTLSNTANGYNNGFQTKGTGGFTFTSEGYKWVKAHVWRACGYLASGQY